MNTNELRIKWRLPDPEVDEWKASDHRLLLFVNECHYRVEREHLCLYSLMAYFFVSFSPSPSLEVQKWSVLDGGIFWRGVSSEIEFEFGRNFG